MRQTLHRSAAVIATAVLAIAGLAVLATEPANAAGPIVGIADSMTNIRPTTSVPLAQSASLIAARNETESFQIVVQGPATSVSVSGDLFGWGTTTYYAERFYTVAERSDAEGATGRWGDILVPQRDQVYGQVRNAFPLTVPAGENRTIWVDVHVPSNATAGSLSSSVAIGSADGTTNVPVSIKVSDWTVPSTSSLPTAFMNSTIYRAGQPSLSGGNWICLAHTGSPNCNGDTDLRSRLNSLYTRLGLDNMLTVANGFGVAPTDTPAGGYLAPYWESRFEEPLIRGTSTFPAGAQWRREGATLTTVAAYAYSDWHCLQACATQWRTEATEAGQDWSSRMTWYGCDEATTASGWSACKAWNDQTQAGWQRPTLAQTSPSGWNPSGIASGIGVTRVAPYVDQVQSVQHGNTLPLLDSWRAGDPQRQVWLATACNAAGCRDAATDTCGPDDQLYVGLPGYIIDAPANASRAMAWMIDRFGLQGELNWAVTEDLDRAWSSNLYANCAHGDGTMFYPGTVAQIGGTSDIPLESARLKHFRDGREDYEVMHFLRQRGYAAQVQAIVEGLYPTMYAADASRDGSGAGSLLAARAALYALLDTATGSAPAAPGRILFSSDRDGDLEIYNMAADGTDVRQMTDDLVADDFPAFSPDSSRIAWTHDGEIWVMDADGTDAAAVTDSPAGTTSQKPAWTPSGQIVFVRSGTADDELWLVDVDGAESHVLRAETGFDLYDPAVSTDGRVYFSRRGGSSAQIWSTSLTGTGASAVDLTGSTGVFSEAVDVAPGTAAPGHGLLVSAADAGYGNYDVVEFDHYGYEVDTIGGAGNQYQASFSPDGSDRVWVSDADGDPEIAGLTANTARDLNPDWGAPALLPPVVPTDPTTPIPDPTTTPTASPTASPTVAPTASPTTTPPDVSVAGAAVSAKGRQRQGKKVRVAAYVRADEAVTAAVRGVVRIPGHGKAALAPQTRVTPTSVRWRVRLTVPKAASAKVLRAVRRWRHAPAEKRAHGLVRATLTVRLTDAAGNTVTITRTVRLT